MAGKSHESAEFDQEVENEARRIVEEKTRKRLYAKQPFWLCSRCNFKNGPRLTHPGHTACEQCGKERDENDHALPVA